MYEGTSAGRRWSRGGRAAPVLALVSALVLAGCGHSKFRYVSNSSTQTYLKVPRAWTAFKQGELVEAEAQAAAAGGQATPSAVDTFIERLLQWRVAFDADPRPSLDHIVELSPQPVVDVRVRRLLDAERDQVSLSSLRNLFIPYDQLKDQAEQEMRDKPVGSPTATSTFRSIDEQELELDGGLRGVRLVFELRGPDDRFYAYDQTALLDAKTSRVYVLLIRAGEKQFFTNSKLLDEIASSFTIKKKD